MKTPGVSSLSGVDLKLHCSGITSAAFAAKLLCTSTDDEVAVWELPL